MDIHLDNPRYVLYVCPIIINMNHISLRPFKARKRICETHIFPVILNYPGGKARLETKYYLNIFLSKQNLSPGLAGDISIGSTDTTLPALFVAAPEKINTTHSKIPLGKRNSIKAITIY